MADQLLSIKVKRSESKKGEKRSKGGERCGVRGTDIKLRHRHHLRETRKNRQAMTLRE